MKRLYLLSIILLAAAAGVLHHRLDAVTRDRDRLRSNQTALLDSVRHYRTAAGREAASVEVLRLEVDELRKHKADAARQIRDLGIRLRRVEATAIAATRTEVTVRAPLTDSARRERLAKLRIAADSAKARTNRALAPQIERLLEVDPEILPPRAFRWGDGHVDIRGIVTRDSVLCDIVSVDTLRQVLHRVPRRFLFIRYGTKAIRQEIVSSNPHSRIVYAEYIQVRRK